MLETLLHTKLMFGGGGRHTHAREEAKFKLKEKMTAPTKKEISIFAKKRKEDKRIVPTKKIEVERQTEGP